MPGIVDPTPWFKAEIEAKRAELEAATDQDARTRLTEELAQLEQSRRRHRWRRVFRVLPW